MSFLKKLITLALVISIAVVASFLYWTTQPLIATSNIENSKTSSIDFTIKSGSTIRTASKQMAQAGVPMPAFLFEVLARSKGQTQQLKAGSFELLPGETPNDLLAKIVAGRFAYASVAIIEGWTFKQMRNAINQHPAINHDSLAMSDAELMKQIDADVTYAEGWFFPDTYLFAKHSSDIEVFKLAHQAMKQRLAELWKARNTDLPYQNPSQLLTMASIIEKETGQASEREMIAAVFINRLKIGMLLQTDPTVIYGMGDKYQGKIRKVDLLTDTPYNTYTRAGLPPTPIALPSLASLKAAINPAPSKAYYFVAKGDGTSQFSENLDQHNRAVNQYIRNIKSRPAD
jgi:UPF0755 protein